MGANESSEMPKLLEEVRKESKYSVGELKQWYGKFLAEYPNGYLTKPQFKELYGKFYPTGDAAAFAEHNFRLFDVNKDDKINFREFMIALGVQCRGTTAEKMDWMFSLFDTNVNGFVSKDEMETILKSMYKMTKDSQYEKTATDHATRIYKSLDKNHDGKLTKDEFVKLGNTDPKLMEMVCGFNA